jgi:hypothetical protein
MLDLISSEQVKAIINNGKRQLAELAQSFGIKIEKVDEAIVESSPDTRKVIIPDTMNKLQAAYNLLKQFEEEEVVRNYSRRYDFFFMNDFIVAMTKQIEKSFSMLHISKFDTNGKPVNGNYIQVPVGFDVNGNKKTERGYVGSIKAPNWEDAIIDIHPSGLVVVRAKLKFEKQVNAFLEELEKCIKDSSVVKGSAVTITTHPNGLLLAEPITAKENKNIVLNDITRRVVDNLIIPALKEDKKTSLLFTGDFGTGKTETAIKVGLQGQKRFGRTFFYVHNAEVFRSLIPYIKNYQRCICFIEDIDQISGGDRDHELNDLLNQLDGNELKNVSCTFIFTTNNHEKIHPAMRRPGRIDQVLHFDYCDKEAIAKIFTNYSDGLQGADKVDFVLASEKCPENLQGAVVAEIAKRAVHYANNLYDGEISTDRFLDAIASMEHHIKFMKDVQKKDHTAENLLGHLMYKSIKKAFPNVESASDIINFTNSPYIGLDS